MEVKDYKSLQNEELQAEKKKKTLSNILVIKESLKRKREAFDDLDCEDIKRVQTILRDI